MDLWDIIPTTARLVRWSDEMKCNQAPIQPHTRGLGLKGFHGPRSGMVWDDMWYGVVLWYGMT